MDRYTIIKPIDDKLRNTGIPGEWRRCIRWNFVDDWFPFTQGIGLPPYPRELWIKTDNTFQEAMDLLLSAARREREKLLAGLGGIADGINIDEGGEISKKEVYEAEIARGRKSGLVIVGGDIPPWKGKQ